MTGQPPFPEKPNLFPPEKPNVFPSEAKHFFSHEAENLFPSEAKSLFPPEAQSAARNPFQKKGSNAHNDTLHALCKTSLRQALVLLLKKKPLPAIGVTELCEKAGVSRMAFYNNYGSIDALLDDVVAESVMTSIVAKAGSPFKRETGLDWYEKVFAIIAEEVDLLKTLFAAGLQYKYMTVIGRLVLHDDSISTEKKYLRIIWTGGFVSALIYWIESDKKADPKAVAKLCFEHLSVYLK